MFIKYIFINQIVKRFCNAIFSKIIPLYVCTFESSFMQFNTNTLYCKQKKYKSKDRVQQSALLQNSNLSGRHGKITLEGFC